MKPVLQRACTVRDQMFHELRELMEPDPRQKFGRNSWVSEETWKLVDKLAVARQENRPNTVIHLLCRRV